MSDGQSPMLEPIEVKEIEFYGDNISAALVKVDGEQQVYVPLRPICEYLGLNWSSQLQRIKRDPVMSQEQRVVIINTHRRGLQEFVGLPLEMLPGWLFGIDANRIKSELRDKIIRYQRECFKVLWRAFQAEALAVTASAPPAAIDYQLAQMRFEIETLGKKLDEQNENAGLVLGQIMRRLGTIEEKTGIHYDFITPEQARTLYQKLFTLVAKLGLDASKREHWQVFMQFYQRYQITRPEELTKDQYAEAIAYLDGWAARG